jgi:UDP-N-acetylglucosamine--N-acetylmuramyl-(pentapeptide) pyrophosphoryl-undecaprenol N-acetylglucosamine transferase
MNRVTFIFAGGGSGGHIFPGLAVAEQLSAIMGDRASFIFLTSQRPVDRAIMEKSPHRAVALPAQPIGVRPRALLRFVRSWGPSVRATRKLIRECRAQGEVHLVAMGGFVAAPAVQAARVEKINSTLVNLDAVPGKANRWMARRVRTGGFTVVPSALFPNWTTIPPIVRSGATSTLTPAQARAALALDPARPTLMITGGSQGSSTINAFVLAFVQAHAEKLAGWQILHQCGQPKPGSTGPTIDQLRSAYASASIPARVEALVQDMGTWWRSADLAISNCGAGSVAEVWCNHTPALLLPYPFHKDEHQKHNARVLVDAGACVLARDHIDAQANLREVGPTLAALLADPLKRENLRQALAKLGPADGAQRLARALSANLAQKTP